MSVERNEENLKIRDRIRKLLNLAEDAGAMKGEIDNALRFANRLMLEHNLTKEEVRADAEPKGAHEVQAAAEAAEYAQGVHAGQGSRIATWELSLGRAILDLIGTVNWYYNGYVGERRTPEGTLIFNPVTGNPVRAATMMFYGPAEDVEAAKALMYEWSLTIVAMARMKHGGALRGPGRSYAEGFASALCTAVWKIKREEQEKTEQLGSGLSLDVKRLASGTADQKALILRDRGSALALMNAQSIVLAKKQQAKKWLKESAGITLRSGSGRGGGGGSHDSSAFSSGREDGSKASGSLGYARRPKLGGGS